MPIGEVDQSFLDEVWVLYAIGMAVVILRFVVRFRSVGLRGMQGDDFFAFLVALFYTCDAATVHIVYYNGTNVEASSVQTQRKLTENEISEYEYGSKIELVAWYSYTALIWSLKGTMLFFFNRMTTGLWQHRLVKWLMWACIISYVAVFLTITFGCFPTQKNWQVVPDPGLKCTFKMQNFVVSVVLNVLTDASILCIPLPLLWTLQVPIKKKIVIGVLLCSGLFVITAAIIRVVLTLGGHPSALNVNRWGVRETIVGIITVNIPILRPVFNKTFWKTGHVSYPIGTGRGTKTGDHSATMGGVHGPYKMTSSVGGTSRRQGSFVGSEEFIIDNNSRNLNAGENDVIVHTMYRVTSEEISPQHENEDWDHSGQSKAIAYGGINAV